MTDVVLTICICSMTKRTNMLLSLLRNLEDQRNLLGEDKDKVEILVESDEGTIPTGKKRNILYNKAQGKYVSSIDDDDEVYNYYMKEILEACKQDPDAIAMNGVMTQPGQPMHAWFISKDLPYTATRDRRGNILYLRFHNHLSPIKKEIAIRFPFPEIFKYEDYNFACALHAAQAVRTEVVIGTSYRDFVSKAMVINQIEKRMYNYKFVLQK